MSEISGNGNFGDDPFSGALQRKQQGSDLLKLQQVILEAAARRDREAQTLSGEFERGLGNGKNLDEQFQLLNQGSSETTDADSLAAQSFQQDNEQRVEIAKRRGVDHVEISREAQGRLSKENAGPSPGEEVGPARNDPLLIDTAQEIQEVELSEPLDRGNNETAAGRKLGQILDQFS